MSVKRIEHNGIVYAEVIRSTTMIERTTFISQPESSFQFGWLAHGVGYEEKPHRHKEREKVIRDLQQMFLVQRGKVEVQLFSDEGMVIEKVVLNPGDAIVLIHGPHAIRVIEDMQCISVKQGPFLGDELDKLELEVSR